MFCDSIVGSKIIASFQIDYVKTNVENYKFMDKMFFEWKRP